MGNKDPVAFLSYVQADDEHDQRRITRLRERLEGEVRMHTGKAFAIFQDKKDIRWGEAWKTRLDDTLLSVTFLIPIITPGYFQSEACRDEFEKFLLREKQLGENRLILPIYYMTSDELTSPLQTNDVIATTVAARNWEDWRELRFKDLNSAEIGLALSKMASTVKDAMKQLEGVMKASETQAPARLAPPSATLVPPKPLMELGPIEVLSGKYDSHRHDEVRKYAYYAYTKEFDEEVHASQLSDNEELKTLARQLAQNVRKAKTANRDALVTASLHVANVREPAPVTILLDNSGSLRGQRIQTVATSLYLVCEVLDQCGIKNEILGYTTRAWKGGLSREAWIRDGKPPRPGRLNDLRHIIYKEFDEKLQLSSCPIALMYREGILKENVDGEALIWAYERVKIRRNERSLIIIISDGAPVDDSTLSLNEDSFLMSHLEAIITRVSNDSSIDLRALDIENTKSLYPKALALRSVNSLTSVLLKHLPLWLEQQTDVLPRVDKTARNGSRGGGSG